MASTLVFDPFSGAAGDMVIGSLLDAGASRAAVELAVERLPVSLRTSRVKRGHLRATRVEFRAEDEWSGTVGDVERLLGDADPALRSRALETLRALARVEARIHGTTPARFRFHDVDTPADVLGAWAALRDLGPGRVAALPVSVGGGSPGPGGFPVPAPATLALLQSSGLEWRGGPVDGELLTPTGAALLATMASAAAPHYPRLKVERVGHGAGSMDRPVPNVLRAVVGREHAPGALEEITVLETAVDDVTGEVLGHLREALVEAGARDVAFLPALMKKGRPGHLIQVVCDPRDALRLAETVARETGTLGVRFAAAGHRMVAAREVRTVRLRLKGRAHSIRIKVGSLGGRVFHLSAEFEDVRRAARASGLPAREVAALAEAEGRKLLPVHSGALSSRRRGP
ncbi:MAG: nickel pincer cofactor biosynthesis protein LarC [Halobacteria archaeon]